MVHHQAVHSPKRCDCRRNQSRTILRRSQFLPNPATHILSAALLHQLPSPIFGITITEYHPSTGLPKHLHCSRANSTPTARNQRHPARK